MLFFYLVFWQGDGAKHRSGKEPGLQLSSSTKQLGSLAGKSSVTATNRVTPARALASRAGHLHQDSGLRRTMQALPRAAGWAQPPMATRLHCGTAGTRADGQTDSRLPALSTTSPWSHPKSCSTSHTRTANSDSSC